MPKEKVKLLLNLVASAISALPRGGDIEVAVRGAMDTPSFLVRCRGVGARAPLHLLEFLDGSHTPPLDTMTIQAYYTCRLAQSSHMRLEVLKDGADVLLSATA
jgi:histidine phosphotransferase ChpT